MLNWRIGWCLCYKFCPKVLNRFRQMEFSRDTNHQLHLALRKHEPSWNFTNFCLIYDVLIPGNPKPPVKRPHKKLLRISTGQIFPVKVRVSVVSWRAPEPGPSPPWCIISRRHYRKILWSNRKEWGHPKQADTAACVVVWILRVFPEKFESSWVFGGWFSGHDSAHMTDAMERMVCRYLKF